MNRTNSLIPPYVLDPVYIWPAGTEVSVFECPREVVCGKV